MKHIYYYVPPCPNCHSEKTGRYVQKPLFGSDNMIINSLKHGEYIRCEVIEPVNNCYCLDCGHEWGAEIRSTYFTDEEIIKEKKKRETDKALDDLRTEKLIEVALKPKKSVLMKFFGL